MELEAGVLVSPAAEVPVINGDIVSATRDLAGRESAAKPLQSKLADARHTVRRYRRAPCRPACGSGQRRGSRPTRIDGPRASCKPASPAAVPWSWSDCWPSATSW